jgi:tripartite-type tricarboxylate transporter receptor subunit TctC
MFKRYLVSFFLALLSMASHAQQGWPDRPVKIIVPFPAGGVPDLLARVIADKLRVTLNQPIIVENRGGAGGNIGTDAVAKASPDGYTLMVSASGPLAINPSLYRSLPFNPITDFEPITLLAMVPNVLVVRKEFPATSVKEFIEYAKKNPGRINYGSIGNGSSQHLAATQFESATGTRMTHIPYRAAPQAVADLVGGQIDCMYQLVPNIAQQVKSGHVRALAVTTKTRSRALPDVPSMAEVGVRDYDTAGWFGLLAPSGTPRPIVDRVNKEVRAILADPAVDAKLTQAGAETTTMDPDEFRKFIGVEIERWREIVKSSGAKID